MITTIVFKKYVLRVGLSRVGKPLVGISATFDDEILLFLGFVFFSFYNSNTLYNKLWIDVIQTIRQFSFLNHG